MPLYFREEDHHLIGGPIDLNEVEFSSKACARDKIPGPDS